MNPSNKKTMEIAMVMGIPGLTKGKLSNGRLMNLYTKLYRYCKDELTGLPALTPNDVAKIEPLIHEFGKATGWEGKDRHIATLASFCLEMLERSQFEYNPKITETLVDIIDYFDRAGKAPTLTFWAGGVAAKKWAEVMEAA